MKLCDNCASRLVTSGYIKPHDEALGVEGVRWDAANCGVCGQLEPCVDRPDFLGIDDRPGRMQAVLECLNTAFKADPSAVQALMVNRIPCNQTLADHPFVVVDSPPTLPPNSWQVGTLGLLNGILAVLQLSNVGAMFGEPDQAGRRKLLGFCEFKPPGTETDATHP